MSGRIFQFEDEFQSWAEHIGGRFIKRPDSFECILPNDAGVVHIDSDTAYIHGVTGTNAQAGNYAIQTNGVKNGAPDETIQQIDDPKKLITTLDGEFGTIELFNTWSPFDSDRDMVRIEVHFDKELDVAKDNWGQMTPKERGERLNALPESHHKQIIIQELKNSGLEIHGLEE